LLSIARRVAADHLRSARVRPRAHPVAAPEDVALATHGDLSEVVALRLLVDRLDPDRRLAFVLTQVVGLSYVEAAGVCECPVGTIRSRVARARGDLTAAMTGSGEAREDQARGGQTRARG
jgi:RNA polymerase sigma-70 factor (ECF subfamily)